MALEEIKNLQKVGNGGEFDAPNFTLDMQSHMILDCCCGEGFSKMPCDYETANGVEEKSMYYCLNELVSISAARSQLPQNLLFPELQPYCLIGSDLVYGRNVERLRAKFQTIIDKRRASKDDS